MVTTKKTRPQRLSRMFELLFESMCSLLIISISVWFFLLINYTERGNRGPASFLVDTVIEIQEVVAWSVDFLY
jgi:hypothetical protein